MHQGAINTAKVLTQIAANRCPDTKVFLAGHSQGAQVVSTQLVRLVMVRPISQRSRWCRTIFRPHPR